MRRNTISIDIFTETAHNIEATRNIIFAACVTGSLPYILLVGERINGPMIKPTMKTETTKVDSTELVEWKSCIACGTPGAKILEAMDLVYVRNPQLAMNTDIRTIKTIHREGVEGNKTDNCPFLRVGPIHRIGNIVRAIPVNEIEHLLMSLFYINFVFGWRCRKFALIRSGSLSHDFMDLSLGARV